MSDEAQIFNVDWTLRLVFNRKMMSYLIILYILLLNLMYLFLLSYHLISMIRVEIWLTFLCYEQFIVTAMPMVWSRSVSDAMYSQVALLYNESALLM